jgi:hypothetical protein
MVEARIIKVRNEDKNKRTWDTSVDNTSCTERQEFKQLEVEALKFWFNVQFQFQAVMPRITCCENSELIIQISRGD